jgi:hypothetical protein
MKKIFMVIALAAIAFIVVQQVQAQTQQQQQELEQIARRSMNGLSPQDRQRTIQIMTDVYVAQGMSRQQAAQFAEMSAESMFTTDVGEMSAEKRQMFEEQQQKIADYEQQQQQAEAARQQQQTPPASNPAQLITPAGKAWIIQDNQVQGSGKAYVFKNGGSFEYYDRVFGIWIPRETNTYTATGARATQLYGVTVNQPPLLRFSHDDLGDDDYGYSVSGTTLEITGSGTATGKYTLTAFPGSEKAGGGNVVQSSGMGWFNEGRQMIFNTSGIYAAYGYPSPWVNIGHEGTYKLNQSTGTITINESVPPQSGRDTEYSYSITDFGGGKKTLRIWGKNRNGSQDEVYMLQAYPSGTKLPRTR